MATQIKKSKPTSPGRRFRSWVSRDNLHKGDAYAPLLEKKKQKSGRNNQGRITTRHRGGGHKKHYRIIDFKRLKDGIPAKVETIEYDPNRSANIALLLYADGERTYIISPDGLKVGDTLLSGKDSPISLGNCMSLRDMPLGTVVHGIELFPGKGAQMARSAGTSAQILAIEGRLRSVGKAGAKRWLGIRPTVRGVAMNPVDHPHGGGEGKTSGGRHPVTPWGVPTKGYKTRKKNKSSNRMIVRRRN